MDLSVERTRKLGVSGCERILGVARTQELVMSDIWWTRTHGNWPWVVVGGFECRADTEIRREWL